MPTSEREKRRRWLTPSGPHMTKKSFEAVSPYHAGSYVCHTLSLFALRSFSRMAVSGSRQWRTSFTRSETDLPTLDLISKRVGCYSFRPHLLLRTDANDHGFWRPCYRLLGKLLVAYRLLLPRGSFSTSHCENSVVSDQVEVLTGIADD